MSILGRVESAIASHRRRRREAIPGPLGDWYRQDGPERIWADLPVGPEDLALDVGGYRGEWTAEMLVRYGCSSWIFEPVPETAEVLQGRFSTNKRVRVFPEAMSHRTGANQIRSMGDASSLYTEEGREVTVKEVDVAEVFERSGRDSIGCMKLNVEGAEYPILERMLEARLLPRVQAFQIQFHRVESTSEQRRSAIRAALERTHRLVLDYPFVWERWDLR